MSRAVTEGIPICVERAHGATLTDVDGNTFLDFAGGIGVLNVGHTPAAVRDAIVGQSGLLLHSCFMVAGYEPYVALAEELVALVPGAFDKKVVLANSGAEAVENAIKIARAATGRDAVIAFSHAYHGRTLLTLTLTAKHRNYKDGFGPSHPKCIARRSRSRTAAPTSRPRRARSSAWSTTKSVAECVAAIVIEPVAGEGGYIPVPPEFMRYLRALCDRIGAVLIFDEVQTGFGRTGTMFACEQSGVDFDLLCLAKSLAAGMPLAAVVGRTPLMDAPLPGGLGGTFSGNPVACAAALAALRTDARTAYLQRAAAIGRRTRERFEAWAATMPLIGEVRGLGPMLALELVADRPSKRPATAATAAVVRYAYEHGLILVRAGMHENIIRFIAPLVIGDAELDEGLAVLEEALQAATSVEEESVP